MTETKGYQESHEQESKIYTGRLVAVGMTTKPFIGYRLSSSSYPHRQIVIQGNEAFVVSKSGFEFEEENSKNPYLLYKCLMVVGPFVIAANGSHIESIANELSSNQHPCSAIEKVLKELGPEQDEFLTPRIVAILSGRSGYLGIVTKAKLEYERVQLSPYSCQSTSTNFFDYLSEHSYDFLGDNSEECSRFLLEGKFFKTMSYPISSVVFMGARMATANVS